MRRLTGCVAAMSRFIPKSAKRALPFFKILKNACPMKWTPEVEAVRQDLKRYLSSTPILVVPEPQAPLLLYPAATNQVVSAALVAQREVDEEAVAMAGLVDGKPEIPPGRARCRQGKAPGRV